MALASSSLNFPTPRKKNAPSNIGVAVLFHFCVQDADLEGRLKIIEELGGKQRMQQVRKYYPGEKPYRMVYCEDPFGNIFELYSHSYRINLLGRRLCLSRASPAGARTGPKS